MFTLFKKTVDSVVADLQAKVGHLETLVKQHVVEAEAYALAEAKAVEAKFAALEASARASRIATKVKELIS